LRDFSETVRQANLTLRPTKCEIGEFVIIFLGHKVSENVIQPRSETVEKVLETPKPCNKKQLRAFLGLTGFYRWFVPNYAAIAALLTDATQKGAPNDLEWTEAQKKAYQELKTRAVNPPILRLPNLSNVFMLQTDASSIGLGAVLMQEDETGMRHPVASYCQEKLGIPLWNENV